jgi:ribosomal protein L37AE/L43A
MTKKNQHDIAGMYVCSHCNESVNGLTYISYVIEEEFVEEWIMLHEKCLKLYKLAKKGLIHKCPKCNGAGNKTTDSLNIWTKEDGSMDLVRSSEMYAHPLHYTKGKCEKIKDFNIPCDLCDGEGYLAKEPIPVITEWHKAP